MPTPTTSPADQFAFASHPPDRVWEEGRTLLLSHPHLSRSEVSRQIADHYGLTDPAARATLRRQVEDHLERHALEPPALCAAVPLL